RRWVRPGDPELPALAARRRLVAVAEDNSGAAGVGSAVALALGDAEVDVPVRRFGIPEQFLAHAKRAEVLADIGLTPVDVAGRIGASLAVRQEQRAAEPAAQQEKRAAGPAERQAERKKARPTTPSQDRKSTRLNSSHVK